MNPHGISATQLLAAREPPGTVALFDIRDPVEAERCHIAGATNLPRRRIEFRVGDLVRNPATPIVVYGDLDDRADLAAKTLRSLGYRSVLSLDGGIDAWRQADGSLVSGSNVPSKAFGEQVQHGRNVPSIDPATLLQWQQEGRRIAICDVRTPVEHGQGCIPGSASAPSFDIALQAVELSRGHDTVVVHCAGRTRSIIGTQTLLEMGCGNVVALENGTMGWRLAGHELERGSNRTWSAGSSAGREHAETVARRLASESGVERIDVVELAALMGSLQQDHYVFDVRSIEEHVAGHVPGCIALPGGQAVQRADDFIAVHGAPIVLIDDGEARANLTGMWLKRMGFADVRVLAGGVGAWRQAGQTLEQGRARSPRLGWTDALAAAPGISAMDAHRWMQSSKPAAIDVDTSAHFRKGHVPGARWLPRSWLEVRIAAVAPERHSPILVICSDGAQSTYAAAALASLGYTDIRRIEGGTRAWAAAGLGLEAAELQQQDDELLSPFQRGDQAMRDYIDWEKLLVPAASVAGAARRSDSGPKRSS